MNALAATMSTLPDQLIRSLTCDRGRELSAHAAFKIETGIPVFFADPPAPGSAPPTRTPTGCCEKTRPHMPGSSIARAAGLH
jgi:hypothetical protein